MKLLKALTCFHPTKSHRFEQKKQIIQIQENSDRKIILENSFYDCFVYQTTTTNDSINKSQKISILLKYRA